MKRTALIGAVLIFVFVMVLSGCGSSSTMEPTAAPEETQAPEEPKSPEPQESQEPEVKEMVYKESPFFQGKGLPPVEERLPKEPKISNEMPPSQRPYEIGTYGGTLRSVTHEQSFDPLIFCILNEPLINSPGYIGEELTPNIVKSFEVSSDEKEFTFVLREGMKWSDGEPLTVDDVQFAIEDVLLNEELNPAGPAAWLRSGAEGTGTPLQFERVDDYTFKIKFDKPYGGFTLQLAIEGWKGYTDLIKPEHFLEKYHKKYAASEEELEAMIAEAGFQPGEWVNLFNHKDVPNWSAVTPKAIGFPVLTPWIQVKATSTTVEYERNPYYFKVDKEGNQLPYIDKLETSYVQDLEAVSMRTLAGEVDHSCEHIPLSKLALFKENEEKSGYTVYMAKLHRTDNDAYLNLTNADPVWRKVVQDVRFRQALNLALDRKDICDTVYYGFAVPSTRQADAVDLDEANRLLDEMGMKKGADGYRVGPDGKRFSIPFEVQPARPGIVPSAELIAEQWSQLGLDVSVKQIEGGLLSTRNSANELKATIFWASGPVMPTWADWATHYWSPLWHKWWNTNGKEGEEPPAEAKEFYQMVADIRKLNLEEANQKSEEIWQSMKENVWFFNISTDIVAPAAVNKKIGNMTNEGFNVAHFFGGEEYFYKP
ncbi:MAG: ABC transporter substrate-binding protein [Clostridia bacterium]